ncbi:hypothetical protein LOK49_LG07G01620 [Camellia lanceoleosa]|uniref:Uncharacterized protein n=1 Tax=Camellia lanceoleosa TaxID=1840588 RepID=A0ACC0H260_9ERIC|nr:hypothetical protein LOK49_LG07G01620 [Camellia lanceoleosa]
MKPRTGQEAGLIRDDVTVSVHGFLPRKHKKDCRLSLAQSSCLKLK